MRTNLNGNNQSTKNVTTKQIYWAGIPQRRPQQLQKKAKPSGDAGKCILWPENDSKKIYENMDR